MKRTTQLMRRHSPMIPAAMVIAAAILLSQRILCYAYDDFDIVQANGRQYKVFVYGFPFRVTDAPPDTGLATPPSETVYRMAGNYMVILAATVAALATLNRIRKAALDRGHRRISRS